MEIINKYPKIGGMAIFLIVALGLLSASSAFASALSISGTCVDDDIRVSKNDTVVYDGDIISNCGPIYVNIDAGCDDKIKLDLKDNYQTKIKFDGITLSHDGLSKSVGGFYYKGGWVSAGQKVASQFPSVRYYNTDIDGSRTLRELGLCAPVPVPNLTVSCSAYPNPVDINQSVAFSSNVSGGIGSYTYLWSGACSGSNQNCANSFSQPGTQTAALSATSGIQTQSANCSVNVNQSIINYDHKDCWDNDVYWYNSNNVRNDLYQNCTDSQICQNAKCVDVACGTNSDCGTDGYTGGSVCYGNYVYKNYKTYTCNNPGTVNANCSNQTTEKYYATCAFGKTCQNGQCVNIACSSNTDCGTNGYVGEPFCNANDNSVYKNYKIYTCFNPGTVNSSCTSSTSPQLQHACGVGKTCTNGSCVTVNIACSKNSDCGSNGYIGNPFCQGNSVYKNYITHACNNPGTASSYCSDSSLPKLTKTCTQNQTCSEGDCTTVTVACNTDSNCGTNGFTGNAFCQDGNVFRNFTTYVCNNHGTAQSFCSNSTTAQLTKACGTNQACNNGSCASQNIACGSNSDCGSNGLTGNAFCQDNNVYKNFITYSCNNPGTNLSYCSSSLTPQLTKTCSPTQTCTNGSCTTVSIACRNNSECGANGYIGSPFCQGNSVYKNYIINTCNNPGTTQSYCSNSSLPQLTRTCTQNQTCSSGSCHDIVIACGTNSDCGTNGYAGSPFCQSGNVYQNYKTYTCNNPGTADASCTNSTQAQLKNTCTQNQTCSSGSCINVNIACNTNSDCGSNGLTGSLFCQSGNVYKNYKTYTCLNPGIASARCTNSTQAQLQDTCTGNQTCYNGQCANIACDRNSDCGTNGYAGSPFCQSGNVYQNYRRYICDYAGTTNAVCSSSDTAQLKNTCTSGQTCNNGSCINVNIVCNTNSDCGTNGYTGDPFCQSNNVYQNYRTYTCHNPGTANSYCSDSAVSQLKNTCTSGQTCNNGSCNQQNNLVVSCYATPNPANSNQSVSFISTVSGGTGSYTYSWSGACSGSSQVCTNSYSQSGTQTATVNVNSGAQTNSSTCSVNINQQNNVNVQTNSATNTTNSQATLNGYIYGYDSYNNNTYVWFQWGTSTSYGNETTRQLKNYSGTFSQNIANLYNNTTYHFRAVAQSNNGQIVYGQDMTFYTGGNTNQNLLTITKTARNMTSSNTGFSNTVYANPSDTLMFLVTIQATGNQDAQNVVVRDYLANNLIYKNQLIVSGATNYSGSYNYGGGDITSGINLGTIPSGQTITITYQTQVASSQNFSYGTTTLTNSVSVTSSNSGYNPTSNASVIVTRTAVYGASSISTGLTNNLWLDSFFLPMLAALVGVMMMRSGMFLGIEKWADNNKKKRRVYKAEKELNSRIAKIINTENI
ncbi:MAG: hypothetical protein A2812_03025 [Candidatus Staskawiczbacteria bacterium RIFCSPHIGHO2_01_FULL_36_16]|uniref:DUF11 domain-containing protein n=1 Tax=Candidatus Staskawiczbacteria bacterium RIFCSPHIGHO2_01_FULL_36_16 TaxID=1802200 RepID=A0A1G2HJD2_9BACT|nr:MAG: hypothetical protein A2812_03025 [Candidatus Staskawiczbacteria bacterium RIFCSPHIGHO2_01_FULL_36_16]